MVRRSLPIPRPPVKWTGGKGQLLEHLLAHTPESFRSYHEPFLGGGAFYFALCRTRRLEAEVWLSDINRELIGSYVAIRNQVEDVLAAMREHKYDSAHFHQVRRQDPWSLPLHEMAARFMYLTRVGYNGLYRVNRAGQFNSSFGRYTDPILVDPDNMRAVSEAFGRLSTHLDVYPFTRVLSAAQVGDLVYFDPPYLPKSRTANFTSYTPGRFTLHDHEVLARTFEELVARDVYVMLSQSDDPWVRHRYRKFRSFTLDVTRNISRDPATRKGTQEMLILGW